MRSRLRRGNQLETSYHPDRRYASAWAGLMGDADTPANDNNRTAYATKRTA